MTAFLWKPKKVEGKCDWKKCKKKATVKLVVNGKRRKYCNQHARWVIE